MNNPRLVRRTSVLAGSLIVLVLALVGLAIVTGLRGFVVTTPSMGTTLPVGTLAITSPESSPVLDDVVAFTVDNRVYTHRIVDAKPGGYLTQGDLNGAPDGWNVARPDIIGVVVWAAPGFGWIITIAPWFIAGVLVVDLAIRFTKTPRADRWWIRVGASSLLFTTLGLWFRPWFNMTLLNWVPEGDAGVRMHVVNTGLFPLDVTGKVLRSGEDAVVSVTAHSAPGRFTLTPLPALETWQWVLVGLFCLIPIAVACRAHTRPSLPDGVPSRPLTLIAAVAASVLAVTAILTLTAHATFAAAITDSATTAGTNSYFTCQAAEAAADPTAMFAWRLAPSNIAGVPITTTESNLTGTGYTGTYTNTNLLTPLTVSSTAGCTRDAPRQAANFAGSTCLATPGIGTAPNSFSYEAWMNASPGSTGPIIGAGSGGTAAEGSFERTLLLLNDGRLAVYLFPDDSSGGSGISYASTASGTSYADSQWHHVVFTASFTPSPLQTQWVFYVDGQQASSGIWPRQSYNNYASWYWHAGCSGIRRSAPGAAPGSPANYLTARLQYLAVYNVALTPPQVSRHYQAGRP